jgi:hypothetical protein
MVSGFVALIGLVVFGFGLLLLWLSVVSFDQGIRDFSSLAVLWSRSFSYFRRELHVHKIPEEKVHQQGPGCSALWSKKEHHRPVVARWQATEA